MKKSLPLILLALLISFGSYALYPMYPTSGTVCIGSGITITDSLSPGGAWSSSDPAIGSIDPSTGTLTGIASGAITITYTLGGSIVTGSFTVNPLPAAITGGTSPICIGAATTLSDATPGGTWSSYEPYIADIGSTSGIVSGISGGSAYILYSVGGCAATTMVTVDASSCGAIQPHVTLCLGSAFTYIDSNSLGGTWSSSTTPVATIGATSGIATGVSTGTSVITYIASGTCGTSMVTSTLSVINTTSTGTFYGAGIIDVGEHGAHIYNSVPGGIWSSGAPSIASIDASTGEVYGYMAGTAPITYTVTGCGGTAYGYYSLTVNSLNGISGYVNFSGTGSPYTGWMRIWLINYNPSTHMLAAVDSITTNNPGTSYYYTFTGLATDSFRVKAAPIDSYTTTFAFMPTYHTSYFYWNDADVVYHTSGGSDTAININMSSGTYTSGPGFIAGDVTTGANKGTSGTVPAANIHVYVVNSSTGSIVKKTITNSAGHYSFTGLPVGATYYIFPDSMNYLTTAYTGITLTTANPGKTTASFVMHTISHTITPNMTGVTTINQGKSEVFTFPNPVSNKLNIQWSEQATETAHVVITDLAGREIYNGIEDMNQGTGVKQIDLSQFANGLYLVTINTATLSYTSKLEIAH